MTHDWSLRSPPSAPALSGNPFAQNAWTANVSAPVTAAAPPWVIGLPHSSTVPTPLYQPGPARPPSHPNRSWETPPASAKERHLRADVASSLAEAYEARIGVPFLTLLAGEGQPDWLAHNITQWQQTLRASRGWSLFLASGKVAGIRLPGLKPLVLTTRGFMREGPDRRAIGFKYNGVVPLEPRDFLAYDAPGSLQNFTLQLESELNALRRQLCQRREGAMDVIHVFRF